MNDYNYTVMIALFVGILLGGLMVDLTVPKSESIEQDSSDNNLWEMGEQRLIFEGGKRFELDVLNEDFYFIDGDYLYYPDSLLCEPHDCSRLTPYYKSYPKAICLVCDYNVSLSRHAMGGTGDTKGGSK